MRRFIISVIKMEHLRLTIGDKIILIIPFYTLLSKMAGNTEGSGKGYLSFALVIHACFLFLLFSLPRRETNLCPDR